MRILITAGPTRAYIDSVRFITNASSGRMGYALAEVAAQAGHDVTLLSGPVVLDPPDSCEVVPFVTAGDLAAELAERFGGIDVLIMAAAVGDFQVQDIAAGKLRRSAGPVDLHLLPTDDLCAAAGKVKRPDQLIVAFAVNDGTDEQVQKAALEKLSIKNADLIVINTPKAMAGETSRAAVLSGEGIVLAWADRPKRELAAEIIKLVEKRQAN